MGNAGKEGAKGHGKTFKKYRFLSPRVIPETHLSIFPVIVIFLLP